MFRVVLFLFLTILLGENLVAQSSAGKLVSAGEKYRKKLDYSPAVKAYREALALDPDNEKALKGLVDIYLNGYQLYDSAAVYLEKQLQHIGPDTNYLVYLNYANCLRFQEKHQEAIEMYNFFKKNGLRKYLIDNSVQLDVDKSIAYSLNAMNNMELIYEPFEVENMDIFINSVESEYTPVYIEEDNLLLYNARYKDYSSERRDMDNLFFENIYYFNLEESVASTFNPSIDQTTHQCVVGKVFNTDTILVFYQNKIWMSTMNEDRLNKLTPLPEIFGNYYFQPHGVFSKDQQTFIFSARGETGNLDLYQSAKVNGTWTSPKPISVRINSAEDEDAPFLSSDGKTLYFSSKGHNSSGGYDFFYSKLENGQWMTPVNMGYPMNSAADDIYISWNDDERSGFFSSNRTGGYGGMDIYTFGLVKKVIKGTAADLEGNILAGTEVALKDTELGTVEKIITEEDGSYSFLVDPDRSFELIGNKKGYFEDVNKVSTLEEDDVITSDLSLEKDPGISLFIKVVDAQTGQPLDSVKVKILDNMVNQLKDSIYTNESGTHFLPLADKKLQDRGSYNITLEKKGYLVVTATYNVLFDHEGKYNVLEDLHVKLEKADVGLDLTDLIDLNPIYFDYNRFIIRPDAAIELDKVVQVMNDNPNMKIELGSHTDSRGSAKQNQQLSDKRAKASAEYIKKRITNPDRITGKGYGESKLVNECSDGVECSELQHQKNRRTEFIILEM